ncbi:LPXTG cell wall anchor domain-containing protein [Paenibacillus sp. SYP-B3998]|uniref:LPXTG cell wall anchor domain-containing protein n=1 Tax=Paenibacillus sp. SYP-B3998 TaxID=2678564 RepID=A0A6G3ZZT4_9BACL|nr:collagen binding domain-containing protein [Paenibacillus sp. SYP-B3998]NEW07736.1 LPXTG cell wall anchor domain-containing protein [Paenibacillus sp. SYP-B3998]
MLKKKTSSLLIALLVFMQSLYGFSFLTPANAATTISGNIIDSVYMAVYNNAGQVVTGNVYEQGSKVQLDYTWSLPNNHGYHNGDVFTFTLPQEFLLFNNISGPLVIDDEDVGTFSVNVANHQVLMTFNNYIESHNNVHGILTFKTEFDKTKIIGSTKQIIKIPINSGEQVFTLNFKPNVTSTIGKSGVPQGFNAKNIDWTVDVNKALDSVQNAVVTDPIPSGLSVPVTVAVYDLDVNLNGTVNQGALVDPSKYAVETTGNVLKVSFNDSPIVTAYRIQFTTPVTDVDKVSFVNKATFEGGNKAPVDASATVSVQHGSALDKTSTAYDPSTQTIEWAIKYNYNEKTIAQAAAVLTDLFNDSQELVAGSVHVFPVTLDSAGVETLGSELSNSQYTVSTASAPNQKGFKLQFGNTISSAYKITYQTKANNRVINDETITNKITSGSSNTGTGTQVINQVVIVKSVGAADYQAKTVAWKIAINGDSKQMSNVVLTDTFPNKGLHFIPSSLVVNEGSAPMSTSDYSVDNTTPIDQGFKITFNKTLTGPVTISYKTEFNNDWIVTAGITNFDNSAKIDWTEGSPAGKTDSATFVPRNEVKNNGFKSGSYNAVSKQLTWTVGVNYNSKTLAGALVEDVLESNQKLVDNSLVLRNMNIPANGDPSQGSVVDNTYYNYTVTSDNKLVVKFLKPISAPYYIVFNTSLEGKLIDNKVNNTAKLLDGVNPVSNHLTASVNIPQGGEYVNKKGTQSGDKIDWTININRGQSTVSGAKIVDTPTGNQLLLPNTFHLFATTVATNGNVSKGSELIKGTDFTLEIKTDDNGKQTFELNFLKEIDTAYILEYQSLIVANNGDTVSNKVSFSGSNVTTVTKDTVEDVIVGVSSGSGTGSGVRGSLTVKKVDSADSALLLSGATFELYRKTGSTKLLINTLTTDSTGTVVFKKLLAGDYVVKETSAPSGYVLDSNERSVTINSTAGFNLNVTNFKVVTPSPTPSVTPPVTPSPSPSVTPSPSPSVTPSPSPSVTPAPTSTPSETTSPSTSPTPSATPSPSTSPTPSATPSPSTSPTPSATPAPSTSPTPSATPAPSTSPTPTPSGEQKTTDQDTPIEGDIDVPLGGIPSISKQPENGKATIDPDGRWTYTPNPGYVGKDKIIIVVKDKDGNETETFVDIDVQEIPLGTTSVKEAPQQTLPKTGETSHLYIQLTGFALILLGVILRKRLWKSK